MTNGVFSEFELDELGVKFVDDSAYENMSCVGSIEEDMEARTVTKKCRGVVFKEVTKGTGRGTLKISAHIPYAIYKKFFGMAHDDLLEGVSAYGQGSTHKEFSITAHVTDEDGVEKLKAYPKCAVRTNLSRKIENGAEEVAELELEIAVMPDANGKGMYESLVSELTDEDVKDTWMTEFEPDLVQIANA